MAKLLSTAVRYCTLRTNVVCRDSSSAERYVWCLAPQELPRCEAVAPRTHVRQGAHARCRSVEIRRHIDRHFAVTVTSARAALGNPRIDELDVLERHRGEPERHAARLRSRCRR